MPKRQVFDSITEGNCSLTLSVAFAVAVGDTSRELLAFIGVVIVVGRTYLAEDAQIADAELHVDGGSVGIGEEGREEFAELALGAESDLITIAVDIG